MTTLKKLGGYSAFYLALAYLIMMVLFMVVLDYPGITNPAEKVALLVEQQMVLVASNLLAYVFFGVALVVLALALHERLQAGAPAVMQVATVLGIIWAGSLVASGMVSNAGMDPVVALYATDPAQAALHWQTIETVASGLGNGNGEILGGLWTLLVSLAALRSRALPRRVNGLGLLVGALGVISVIPGLVALVGLYGLLQIVWFVGVGVTLLRGAPAPTA